MNGQPDYQTSDFTLQIGSQFYSFTPSELMVGVGVILIVGLMLLWWKCR